MSAAFFVRQGDILLVRVRALPASRLTERPRDAGQVILAYGEVTGHAHAIVGKAVVHYDAPDAATAARQLLADVGLHIEVGDASAPSFLDVIESAAELTHNEHATHVLTPGRYVVLHQTEWSDALEPVQAQD